MLYRLIICLNFLHGLSGKVEVTFIYIILSAILLWFVIGSRGEWSIKMFAIFATLMFSLNIARSLDNLSGWATMDHLPPKFLVHWVMVKEPDDSSDIDGNIYLWVNGLSGESEDTWEFFDYDRGLEPRAYSLPYSLEMHEISIKMKVRLKMGEAVVGMSDDEHDKLNSPGQLLKSLLDKEKKKQIGSIDNYDSDELFFYALPPSNIETKSQ